MTDPLISSASFVHSGPDRSDLRSFRGLGASLCLAKNEEKRVSDLGLLFSSTIDFGCVGIV